MIIQESLYKRIESLIERKKSDPKNEDIKFKLSKSNTTNSIYILIYTYAQNEQIRIKFRISDHYNSEVKTKVLKKATNFSYIERKMDQMISRARSIRFNNLVKKVCKKDV
jgi:hypothetical protein